MTGRDESAIVRAWLQGVLAKTGLKATPLAKAAGLAPSTVLRALDPDTNSTLDTRTIAKIVDKFGIAPPPLILRGERAGTNQGLGFAAPELEALLAPDNFHFAGKALTPTQGLWTVRTRAIELAGYVPGDDLLADSAVGPRARDAVVVQILDQRVGTAETVLRVYDPPYVITETADPTARAKPLLVDNDRVAIWGVVVAAMRKRAA